VTLKAGKDYWIQYYFENCDASPDAYYLNETGTEYKNLALNNYSYATPVDMSTISFVGKLFDSNSKHADMVATILQLNEDDVFLPNKGSNWPIQGMTANNFYKRNSSYINKSIKQVDHDSMTSNKNKPTMSELSDMNSGELIVIGYTENNADMVSVWERTDVTLPTNITDYSNISSKAEIANWMVAANVVGNGSTFSNNNWPWPYKTPDMDGSIYIRTDKGSIKFSSSSDALDAPPESPIIGALYLKAEGAVFPGVDSWQSDIIVFYDGNQWQMFASNNVGIDNEYTMADGTTKIRYFEKINDSSFATDISSSVWDNNNPHIFTILNPQPTIIDITQTQSDYIKHYLEINGNEVTS
jgi:hypothetical protein